MSLVTTVEEVGVSFLAVKQQSRNDIVVKKIIVYLVSWNYCGIFLLPDSQ